MITNLPQVDPSILSIFHSRASKNHHHEATRSAPSLLSHDLSWYLPWLAQQVAKLPECLKSLAGNNNAVGTADLSMNSSLYRIFMAVSDFVCEAGSPSIDEILEQLNHDPIIHSAMTGIASIQAQRLLIFAVLGWQTMLYVPSFNTCSLHQLAVHQDIDQPNSGLIFDTFKLSVDLADRPMAILLKGYGNLLPAKSLELTTVASETSRVASSWLPVNPLETNAHLLHDLLRVEVRWVEMLALHLDYDKSTRTLSLFRYPSLCVAMLQSGGALYSFASTESNASDPRANRDEIDDILGEVLLSYRLLFGQSKPSRKLFRRLYAPREPLSSNCDALLRAICGQNYFVHQFVPQDRPIYFAQRDFPVLGERVELLAKELQAARPKSWRDLLRDRRDTTQYWTFWLVAIVGGASILLSSIQVILQAIQIWHS